MEITENELLDMEMSLARSAPLPMDDQRNLVAFARWAREEIDDLESNQACED